MSLGRWPRGAGACPGHREADPLDGLHVYHTIVARHPGRCAVDKTHSVEPGDWIGRTEQGWVCTACKDRAQEAIA